jgi:outer membrane protein W
MTRCLMVLSVIGLLCAGAANAEVRQGDTELNFLAGFMSQNSAGASVDEPGLDFESWFLSGGFGYFLTDNLQVAAVGFGLWSSITIDNADESDQDLDLDVYGIGVQAKWHFMPANLWVPYVGGQLLWATVDMDASDINGDSLLDGNYDGTLWGPVAGLRYELNATNDFVVEYQYHVWNGDIGHFFDDGHALFAGIIHQFK